MLRYLPGVKNFLAALSRMPQYNCPNAEVVKPLLASKQLAAQVTTQAQEKENWQIEQWGDSCI